MTDTIHPFMSAIIDFGDNEKFLHIAARGTPIKNKECEIAMKLSHLNISDENEEWRIIKFGLPNEAITQLSSPGSSTIIFAGTSMGNIYKSIDAGENWHRVSSGLLDNCLMLHCSSLPDLIYASSNKKAIRSQDGGKTWEELNIEFGGQND